MKINVRRADTNMPLYCLEVTTQGSLTVRAEQEGTELFLYLDPEELESIIAQSQAVMQDKEIEDKDTTIPRDSISGFNYNAY